MKMEAGHTAATAGTPLAAATADAPPATSTAAATPAEATADAPHAAPTDTSDESAMADLPAAPAVPAPAAKRKRAAMCVAEESPAQLPPALRAPGADRGPGMTIEDWESLSGERYSRITGVACYMSTFSWIFSSTIGAP